MTGAPSIDGHLEELRGQALSDLRGSFESSVVPRVRAYLDEC